MEYSYNQLREFESSLEDSLRDIKQEEYYIRVDIENNRVILFFENQNQVEEAITLAGTSLSILQVLPIAQFDVWAEERSAPPAVQTTEPVEPSVEMAGKVMPGIKNAFYKANGTMSSGTVGFTSFLTYNGRGDDDLGLERGDTVEAVFTHGHDISGLYPYSSIQGSAPLQKTNCTLKPDQSAGRTATQYLSRETAAEIFSSLLTKSAEMDML